MAHEETIKKQTSNFYETVNPDILPPTAKKVIENKQRFTTGDDDVSANVITEWEKNDIL